MHPCKQDTRGTWYNLQVLSGHQVLLWVHLARAASTPRSIYTRGWINLRFYHELCMHKPLQKQESYDSFGSATIVVLRVWGVLTQTMQHTHTMCNYLHTASRAVQKWSKFFVIHNQTCTTSGKKPHLSLHFWIPLIKWPLGNRYCLNADSSSTHSVSGFEHLRLSSAMLYKSFYQKVF